MLSCVKGVICLLTQFLLLRKFTSFIKAWKRGSCLRVSCRLNLVPRVKILGTRLQQTFLSCGNVLDFFWLLHSNNVWKRWRNSPYKVYHNSNSCTSFLNRKYCVLCHSQALVILLSVYSLKNVSCKKTLWWQRNKKQKPVEGFKRHLLPP